MGKKVRRSTTSTVLGESGHWRDQMGLIDNILLLTRNWALADDWLTSQLFRKFVVAVCSFPAPAVVADCVEAGIGFTFTIVRMVI